MQVSTAETVAHEKWWWTENFAQSHTIYDFCNHIQFIEYSYVGGKFWGGAYVDKQFSPTLSFQSGWITVFANNVNTNFKLPKINGMNRQGEFCRKFSKMLQNDYASKLYITWPFFNKTSKMTNYTWPLPIWPLSFFVSNKKMLTWATVETVDRLTKTYLLILTWKTVMKNVKFKNREKDFSKLKWNFTRVIKLQKRPKN